MDKVILHKINEVYCRIEAPDHILMELSDSFSFFAAGYKYHPKFKARIWDGKIRLLNTKTKRIYLGLADKIEEYCQKQDIEFECSYDNSGNSLSIFEFDKFLKTLNLPFEMRDYQKKSAIGSIRNKRQILLSPTASGKSLIIYSIIRYLNLKTLLIVPTTALVLQMRDDFKNYSQNDDSWDVDEQMAIVMGGKEKQKFDESISIICTTWQSIYNLDKRWYDDKEFDVVILDEAHNGKAASLTSIMEKLTDTEYRIGTTGTLDDIQVHELTLHGLFGAPKRVVETKELIESKHLSEMQIKCIVFSHGEKEALGLKKLMGMDTKKAYMEELKYIVSNKKRNDFIVNLALSVEGNSLLLYNFVEDHGMVLYELLKKKTTDKEIFFVSGDISAEQREEIRKTVEEKGKNCIIVASLGTFSTGINIVNLHNIFFTHPTKAKIKLLQSIGRGLRKGNEKFHCVFFDFSDDLRVKTKKNYTYIHFLERLKIYIKEKFTYKIYKVDLSKKGSK